MSRIGKKEIEIPSGVSVDIKGADVTIKGPLGEDSLTVKEGIDVVQEDNLVKLSIKTGQDEKMMGPFYGLFRSLLNNIVVGVSKGFEKNLEILGVGYRAQLQGKDIQFQLGYSHPIMFAAPDGITFEVPEPTKITVKGISKQQVGQTAANIRELRPPEPYKGKGIRYKDEYVRRKAGKAGK